jgi:AmiR/NasT family two-component response regulator
MLADIRRCLVAGKQATFPMISCLVLAGSGPAAPALDVDLEAAGIHVLGAVLRGNLVQEAVRLVPDLVVCHESTVDEGLFGAIALLQASSPRPVVLFTSDPDADKMARALEVGIHVYVVNGYAPQRLRPLIHLAQARFAHEQKLRADLADVSHRFEERKLVDRAKGILMRARQVSEEEAFRVLRAASMHSNQRVGQVSQHVIAAAGLAEAINRAGQLRMLSQRLVKLYALASMGVDCSSQAESCARVDANLSTLVKTLSKSTYGDLLDAVTTPWTLLKTLLAATVDAVRLQEADALAERMLLQADRLVTALETTGAATTLHVINVAGRQRMLSQRVAKQALLAVLLTGEAATQASAETERSRHAFEEALGYLNAAPLTTRDIRESLDEAGRVWDAMSKVLARPRASNGPKTLADASETLLMLFDRLTQRYEHSMQVLVG